MGFNIKHNEDLVQRFSELENRLNKISSLFKNGDVEVSHDVWENYIEQVSEFKELFNETIYISDDAFKLN